MILDTLKYTFSATEDMSIEVESCIIDCLTKGRQVWLICISPVRNPGG